ncbi:MAG: adenylosuccinate synthase [Bdellovibrionaceae bacterium]|nr:adenylosuccinate synthase [Pseudobdellovibrionaceae bacterium]
MPGIIVVGSQWGDEGKGKVVDVFSAESDYVVRYQGGANAGHTLVVDGKKTVLHLVPSGVLHKNTKCLIAAGVVLDVEQMTKEISALKKAGLLEDHTQLGISDGATVLLSFHRRLDMAREKALKNEKIGTTGKGIGPAYEDRASRRALLFGHLFLPTEMLREKIERSLKEKNFLLENFYGEEPISVEEALKEAQTFAEELASYRCKDTSWVVYKALKDGKKVLFEGAQGTLLDLTHGTYPFVTSSSTLAGSACSGVGIGPTFIQKVIGITKAYTTRVGSGPFPTELHDELGAEIQRKGAEFGATTGRPRRCGWLDLVALKYAIRTNGLTSLALMKMDVLSGLDEIKVCTGYKTPSGIVEEFPMSSWGITEVEPVYETLKGWSDHIDQIENFEDLPQTAKDYVKFIAEKTDTPVGVVSVGPSRQQTLWLSPLF